MDTRAFETLVTEWRNSAATLHEFGADSQAKAIEACADTLEERLRERGLEELSLEEAARVVGCSYEAMRKRVARGDVPNAGEPGHPRVLRRDLNNGRRKSQADAPSLAEQVLAAKAGS